jgi:FAD/FMN-containing dehydrogenase
MTTLNPNLPPGQTTFRRNDPSYDMARRATMWNARVPDRFPDVIVRARDVYDVVAAVKLAKREGLRLSVRSGGHSWAGNHVRDGGLLLDLSAMQAVTLDKAAMRATTEPGRAGHELCDMLVREDLFFPSGHCKGVCVGGYLLQGGFGWHSRTLGLACMSVIGLDLVTIDGDLVHASPTENPDLYWAARGAGPGFFCVVTRFHLRVYPKPRVIGLAAQSYSLDHLEEVVRFFHEIGPSVPQSVELQLLISRNAFGVGGPGIELVAPVFADGYRDALRDLSFLNQGPLRRKASLKVPFAPLPMSLLYAMVMQHYPDRHRWGVDNMWTRASFAELWPGLRKSAETLPPAPSHILLLNWAPPPTRPDMVFSVEDRLYMALYGCWQAAGDDAKYGSWARDRMAEMAPLATGCQLADENLGQRPARFFTDDNLRRLDEIRAVRDPQSRFHSYMGRP